MLIFSIFCYIFLPEDFPEQWILYQRFSVFVLISLIFAASILFDRLKPFFKILLIAVVFAHWVLSGLYFVNFDTTHKGFNEKFLPGGNLNKKLGGLIFDNDFHNVQSCIHFPDYYIIWQKGIAQTSVIDYRFGIIRRKVSQNELPFYDAWLENHDTITKNYKNLDYKITIKRQIND